MTANPLIKKLHHVIRSLEDAVDCLDGIVSDLEEEKVK